ncbi:MAG TPA: hypothetical protein VFO70_08415, partial [Chitinophagaceae bacterium]|nr:hypothetical protein [Chitinophagaceae bacterium]
GLLTVSELFKAWLLISIGMLVAFFLFYLIYKNKINAGIAATLTGILYLFFGDIKQALASSSFLHFISHYKILLPLLALLTLLLTWRLYKSRPLAKGNYFLNLLFIIYLGIEAWNLLRLEKYSSQQNENISLAAPSNSMGQPPGIYYIVPDSYPSSDFQKKVLGIKNNEFDSLLFARGFYIVEQPKSNYNNTPFSIASTFQMDYHSWLHQVETTKPYHYNRAILKVKESPVISRLMDLGYSLNNLSIFDLPGQPSIQKENFLSVNPSQIIYYNMLWNCLERDLGAHLFPAAAERLINQQKKQKRLLWGAFRDYNQAVLDSLASKPETNNSAGPQFTYAHLEMPHAPYFFDSSGKAYPDDLVYGPDMLRNKNRFSNYTAYTNSKLTAVVDSILLYSKGRDIIIIQSDHGINSFDKRRKNDVFSNYTAIYFPDRDYKELYPAMSNVNTFRIIFNKYFGQQLPLLKDSTIYLE